MSLKIERVTDAVQTYEIPAVKGTGFVKMTLPDWDCQPPAKLEEIDTKLKEAELNIFQSEGMRIAFLVYNNDSKVADAINALVTRQIVAIGNDWTASGDAEEKAESGSSSDSSKKTED